MPATWGRKHAVFMRCVMNVINLNIQQIKGEGLQSTKKKKRVQSRKHVIPAVMGNKICKSDLICGGVIQNLLELKLGSLVCTLVLGAERHLFRFQRKICSQIPRKISRCHRCLNTTILFRQSTKSTDH